MIGIICGHATRQFISRCSTANFLCGKMYRIDMDPFLGRSIKTPSDIVILYNGFRSL